MGATVATGLREAELSPSTFAAIDVLVDELSGRSGKRPDSALFGVKTLERLFGHTERLISREAPKALPLARLGVLIAPRTKGRTPEESAKLRLLEGDAHRWLATTLLHLGRCQEAWQAALAAKSLYRLPIVAPMVNDQEARLDLAYGQILFQLGQVQTGLDMISGAARHLLVVCGNKSRFIRGQTIYAGMLIYQDNYEEALTVLDEAGAIATEINDTEMSVYILANACVCLESLGRPGADVCHERSLEMLEQRGMNSEIPRTGYVRVAHLKRIGRIDEAISELYKIRTALGQPGMEVVAAQVTALIVADLVSVGRLSEAAFIGYEAIEILSAAGSTRDATNIRNLLETGRTATP
jgi:tetratricopeptide (TPR) repeat protein